MSEAGKRVHQIETLIEHSLLPVIRGRTQTITLSEGEHHHYLKHFGNHGTETFEDVIFHPKREWKAHKLRQAALKEAKKNGKPEPEKDLELDLDTGKLVPSPKEILIHIKQMNGSHTFDLKGKDLDIVEHSIHLTPEEKTHFGHVTNTDELRRHCMETKRAVKMVFDSDIELNSYEKSDSVNVIALNDNIFLEMKPVDFDNETGKGYVNPKRKFFKALDADLSDNLEEKTAGWLELFYDLFYIVSLSQFTHTHHIIDPRSFLVYAGWFVILWWAWMASAIYTTRFDTGDVVHHIFKLIEMYGIVGMAGSSNNYYTTDAWGFTISYIVLKSVLIMEYSLVYYYAYCDVKKSASIRPLRCFLIVNIVSLVMWGGSLVLETPGKYGLWYGSIALEIFVSICFRNNKETSIAKSHLGERIGLLTLIVLGENVIGLVRLLASESNVILIVCEMMGVTILFGFFYIYFDDFSMDVLAEAKLNYLWIFAHFPLHLFQISVGIALTDLISIERTSLGGTPTAAQKSVAHIGALFSRSTTEPEHGTTSAPASPAASPVASPVASPAGSHGTLDTSPLTTSGTDELHLNSTFVATTFLVSAALVLFVNALIKMLHSQLADKNTVIIILIRMFTVVVLFALIAVPYEMWGSALGLLGFMTGMMVLQAAVDFLD